MSLERVIVGDADLFTKLVTGNIASDESEYSECCHSFVQPVNPKSLFGNIIVNLSAHLLKHIEDQTVNEKALKDFQRGLPPQWQALVEYYIDVFIDTNTRIRPGIFFKVFKKGKKMDQTMLVS